MKSFLLKLDSDVYTAWCSQAKAAGLTVSEWIRRNCTATPLVAKFEDRGNQSPDFDLVPALEESIAKVKEKKRGRSSHQGAGAKDPSGVRDVPLVSRSVDTPGRVERLDGQPIYKTHLKSCGCQLCDTARKAGLK